MYFPIFKQFIHVFIAWMEREIDKV